MKKIFNLSNQTWSEILARALIVLLVLGLPLGLVLARSLDGERMIEIHARMPEQGGWTPADLTVRAGETLNLRLVSDDVMHSFAIGQSDAPAIDLKPGQVVETSLTFDHPGKYTYYCTRWCGPNHWRMRGTIEVLPAEGKAGSEAVPETKPPLFVELGLDIDAPHPAKVTPEAKPSVSRGANLEAELPPAFQTSRYYRSHSPVEVWEALRLDASTEGLSDQQVWDLVAYLWFSNTSPEALAQGKALYAQNCASCHGEAGAGDGVFAQMEPDMLMEDMQGIDGHSLEQATDFTDPEGMLGASPALLQGKIVRGGMGTGMPYWGPIFTEEEIWSTVDYLWTYQFEMEEGS